MWRVGLPPAESSPGKETDGRYPCLSNAPGVSWKKPANLRQLEEIIVSFSNLIIDFPEIRAMDINPLAVSDGKPMALDARILVDDRYLHDERSYPHLVITPYPSRYITLWHLRDGREVILRPVRPEDEPLEHEMFLSLSEETLRGRFYQTVKTITHEMHVRFCNIDYDREMTIVGEIRDGNKRRLIGIGSYVSEPGGEACEFSVIVHEEFQGQGLAAKLIDMLIGIADEKGIKEFFGYVEPQNRRMIALARKLGMTIEKTPYDLLKMTLYLQ